MPITQKTTSGGNGINYTYEADAAIDHALIPNSTYFRDKSDSLIYYKNALGDVLSMFTESLSAVDIGKNLYVTPTGNNASGTIGNPTKPYLTLEGARDAALTYYVRRYVVTTAAVATSIFLDDGSGMIVPATFSSNAGTTKAADAAALVAAINADPIALTASQDNPGVDEYFYITADVPGNIFTGSALTNLTLSIKLNIFIAAGSYTVTDINGLHVSGVNWHCDPGVTITKTAAGPLFNITPSNDPFVFKGSADILLGGAATYLLGPGVSYYDVDFECRNITQTAGVTFITSVVGANTRFRCKVNNISNTSGYIWEGNQAGYNHGMLDIEFGNVVCQTSCFVSSIYVIGVIKGNRATSTTGDVFTGIYLSNYIFDINEVTATAPANYAFNINGNIYNNDIIINCGTSSGIRVEGGVVNYTGRLTNLLVVYGSVKIDGIVTHAAIVQGGEVEFKSGSDNNSYTVVTGGTCIQNMSNTSYGPTLTCSAGTLILRGRSNNFYTLASRTVSGTGKLICEADIIYGGSDYLGNREIFTVAGGTLLLRKCTISNINNIFSASGVGIVYSGGNLICDGATILTNSTTTPAIRVDGMNRNIKVLTGGLNTNRPENGGTLAAKSQVVRFTVLDNTGSDVSLNGTQFISTLLTTAADIAAELVGLVNADVLLPVTASQDNPGIDDYFYCTADAPATLFTIASNNLTETVLTYASYALTNTIGGTIIDDTDIE